MKLSISNIAWDKSKDEEMYQYLSDHGFNGLEIAPTRLVSESPYNNITKTFNITNGIKERYNLDISSMQSIWYGRTESIFGTDEDRKILYAYTEKAIKYAQSIDCKNLVFGCPRNRNLDDASKYGIAVDFFGRLGDCADHHGVVIALEPNPVIYNTNFMNRTEEAIRFVKEINSKGLQINLDLGTIIWNNEDIDDIFEDIGLIHHIHISEPNLVQIEKRELHIRLKEFLIQKNYKHYISIEMKNYNDIDIVKQTINYINEVML
jgi:sugar phosphate isomerase/epimerase